jgi:hypothetical protein
MKNEIKEILKRYMTSRGLSVNPLEDIEDAAEAIVKLVEWQPVDIVRAMATLVKAEYPNKDYSDVPGDDGHFYTVRYVGGDHWRCWRRAGYKKECCDTKHDAPCNHIEAVLAARESENA